ncbi:MAG: hypothetical protein ABI678_13480 [Kofleriaceae bacterium]
MTRWVLLALALVACDAGKPPAPPPVAGLTGPPVAAPRDAASIDAVVPDAAELGLEPGEAPTCPPAAHAAMLECLRERSPCSQRVEVFPQRLPDLELVHTIASGCADTYVIAKHADRWYAIAELYYEQAHGRRNSELKVRHVRDARAANGRISQIDFSTDEDTSYIDDTAPDGTRDEHTHSNDRLACLWPDDGVPTCAPAPIR